MATVGDIAALLKDWGDWKDIREKAARVPELEARVAALEEKLNGTWPPDVCRKCGARALRLHATFIMSGGKAVQEQWDCAECRGAERRLVPA